MPRRREARPLAEHYGDLVRVALMEARPAGLHTYQLMAATRLTRSQVGRGMRTHGRPSRPAGSTELRTPAPDPVRPAPPEQRGERPVRDPGLVAPADVQQCDVLAVVRMPPRGIHTGGPTALDDPREHGHGRQPFPQRWPHTLPGGWPPSWCAGTRTRRRLVPSHQAGSGSVDDARPWGRRRVWGGAGVPRVPLADGVWSEHR